MRTEHIGRAVPYLDTDHYIIVKGGWTDGSVPIPDELVGSVVQEEFFTWYSEVGNRQDSIESKVSKYECSDCGVELSPKRFKSYGVCVPCFEKGVREGLWGNVPRDYDDLLKKYLALKDAYDRLVGQKLKKIKI